MKRKDFLRLSGLAGAASLLPWEKLNAGSMQLSQSAGCVLIPTETAGPYPLDLSANNTFFRQDIRENKTGVLLNLKMKILGLENCGPIQNVRVNIWHCDKDGLYSGYNTNENAGQQGLTYLRGYQMTDAYGQVEFVTVFPGWYNGRICHIHFQVYVSSTYAAISQLTFDPETKNALYAANASLYTKGADPMTLASDNIFSDGYNYQLASLTPNTGSGGYDAYLEVTVKGSGTLGIGNTEKETAKQLQLGQNFPNPYFSETSIPLSLIQPSDVRITLWDLSGRQVAQIQRNGLSAGEHQLLLNMSELGIPSASYVYQAEVKNASGSYKQSKMMTAVR